MWFEPIGLEILPNLAVFAFTITVPGYFWTLAFFPEKKSLGGIERFAFSLLFSITFLPMLVLLENVLFRVPVEFATIFSTLAVLAIISVAIFLARTQRIKAPDWVYRFFPKVKKEESADFFPKIL